MSCQMPNAFDRASDLKYTKETCIDQSAYDELLSMWSHRKKINFTVAFEIKQIHYVDCSKFKAYPAEVGITTSLYRREKHLKRRLCRQSKEWPKTHWRKCRREWIFLSRAAIRRTWRKFPDMQQRMTSLDKSECLFTIPNKTRQNMQVTEVCDQKVQLFLRLNRHRRDRTEENMMLYDTTHNAVRNHADLPKTW
jgi:hypothetical protein